MYLTVDFWIDRTAQIDELLADRTDIKRLVSSAFANDPHMMDLADYPETLPGGTIATLIRAISKPYAEELHFRDGGSVEASDYARYTRNLNLDALADSVDIRFGMIVRRANMRAWPTRDSVFKSHETFDLDRFQENGLFPADAVAILHESADGEWCFVQSYNYAAWILSDHVVVGDRKRILDYRAKEDFIVVSGNKVTTNFNPKFSDLSELQLDMGVRLPLVDAKEIAHDIHGQNPQSSHAVLLPVRGEHGELQFHTALIARNQDVNLGYMPYTRRNILHQAFKFLGERYGWGHSYNARDCSGLVMEVYKTFGILLPRNTLQQRESPIGKNIRLSDNASVEEKLDVLDNADVGDLLYSPGHVMLYLGNIDGAHYVIHSLFGAGWTDDDGNFQEGVLNGVSVTPIREIFVSPGATYFDQFCSIKKIR